MISYHVLNDAVDLCDRFNTDINCNAYGKHLIKLCTNTNMFIGNGRTSGDIPGKTTCIQSNGNSTVDYAVSSVDMQNCIKYFNVTPLTVFLTTA